MEVFKFVQYGSVQHGSVQICTIIMEVYKFVQINNMLL